MSANLVEKVQIPKSHATKLARVNVPHPGVTTISGTICSHYSTLRAYIINSIIKGNNNFRSLKHASINEFKRKIDYMMSLLSAHTWQNYLNYIVNEEDYYHIMISNFGSFKEGKFDINFERCQYHYISKPYYVATPCLWCEIFFEIQLLW